jgi:hypothetical protein
LSSALEHGTPFGCEFHATGVSSRDAEAIVVADAVEGLGWQIQDTFEQRLVLS